MKKTRTNNFGNKRNIIITIHFKTDKINKNTMQNNNKRVHFTK